MLTVHVPVRVGRVGAEVAKGARLEIVVEAIQVAEAAVEASGLGEVRGGGAAHVPAGKGQGLETQEDIDGQGRGGDFMWSCSRVREGEGRTTSRSGACGSPRP